MKKTKQISYLIETSILLIILIFSLESLQKKSYAQSTGVNKVMTHSDHYYFHGGYIMGYCRAHAFAVNINPVFDKIAQKELKSFLAKAKKNHGLSSKEVRDLKRTVRDGFPDCPI